ncbi:hypothetical protein BTHE68_72060 (plasmid) [Burkholderia sp. THE68]|uniref:phage tail protein n=1 Tax=Burkholderia sp. THE68 TaxID=758782 RepID=UPI0013174526|nr:phage tail protein [Burkholderia sp. THE68]BBU33472.1 hypothetical protein BTHE68_72060 [Burkholderia sp. THE68]
MNRPALDGYRFATPAQFRACIETGADMSDAGLQPLAPYGSVAVRRTSAGGHAPAVTRAGDLLWRDDAGRLHRLAYADTTPTETAAPVEIARAERLVAGADTVWAANNEAGSIAAFDLDTLAWRVVAPIEDAEIADIASDAREGVFALLVRDGAAGIAHVDRAGRVVSRVSLQGASDAMQLAYLARAGRIVILTRAAHPALLWYPITGGAPVFRMPIAELRPCFNAAALASDACARLFVAGSDGEPAGGRHHALVLDAAGELIRDLIVEDRPGAIAGDRLHLCITDARGLLCFEAGGPDADTSSEVRAELLTPPLTSASQDRYARWLRVDVSVHLPAGASLEIAWTATDDPERLAQARRIANDASLTRARRQNALHDLLGPWRSMTYHGDETPRAEKSVPLSAPLFDVREQWLWVSVALAAPASGETPSLSELVVRYQGATLMDELPAVYRRGDADGGGGFLRSLVGVLESSTQSLDARIGRMAAHMSPDTAPGAWLDFVARWLGLPWDDALAPAQKRALLARAETITAARGTRSGLEALLDCLMPDDMRRRFRVVDFTTDFGMAKLASGHCEGGRLPAVLGGLPTSATELGAKAVLGHARLPPAGEIQSDASRRFAGCVRIDMKANAHEQADWEPWLAALLGDMVPANVRVRLRWLGVSAPDVPLLDDFVLDDPPEPHLGDDAVTGVTRLPGHGAGSDTSLY